MAGLALDDVWVKVHKQGKQVLVAICDADLLGKEIKHGDVTIRITERFYGGFLTDIEEALRLMEEATSANLIGTKIVEAAVKRGFIHREAVVEIASIPHAMMVKV
ncbi:MAG: DUF424 domain-containing protein [Thermoprotei archaeon]|nr:MAG: DUF424 domain-containing protein [Thermoprotei archaeon]